MASNEELFLHYNNAGIDLKQEGKYRESIQHLEKALTYFQEPVTYNALGKVYFIVGEYEKTITALTNGFIIEYKQFVANPRANSSPAFASSMNHYGYAHLATQGQLDDLDRLYYLAKIDPYRKNQHLEALRPYAQYINQLQENERDISNHGFSYCNFVCSNLNLPPLSQFFG